MSTAARRPHARPRKSRPVSCALHVLCALGIVCAPAACALCTACAQQTVPGVTDPNLAAGGPASPLPISTHAASPTPTSSGTTTPPAPTRLSSFCPSGPFGGPLPQNPTVNTLNTSGPTFDHFDGPVWLPALGKIYFSAWNNAPDAGNGPESTIMSLTPPSTFATVSPVGNFGTNGLALDTNGCVVAAAHDRQEIARFCNGDPNTRMSLASMYQNLHFNSPNDAAVRWDGNIYFTDPDYQQDNRAGQAQTRVYRIAPNGAVSVVDGGRNEPNGIALSLDENWLLVGGNDGVVLRYPIAADGSTGAGQPFITIGNNGDGMVVDCAGNLYVSVYAENRVAVWDINGQTVGSIPVAANVTNLAFGDSDHKTLYITTVSGVQSVRLQVPGLPH